MLQSIRIALLCGVLFAQACGSRAHDVSVVRHMTAATVQLRLFADLGGVDEPVQGGSAVVIADGWAVTAAHCAKAPEYLPATTLKMATARGWLPVAVVAIDDDNDVALLKLPTGHWHPAPIRWKPVSPGETLWVVGYPWSHPVSVSRGVCSAVGVDAWKDGCKCIQTDAALNPGDSGGGTFDNDGYLVGINDSLYNPSQTRTNCGLGFSVPVRCLHALFAGHVKK